MRVFWDGCHCSPERVRPRREASTRRAICANRHKSRAVVGRFGADAYCWHVPAMFAARHAGLRSGIRSSKQCFFGTGLLSGGLLSAWPGASTGRDGRCSCPFSGDSAVRHPFRISRLL